jgi:hypothetical protein
MSKLRILAAIGLGLATVPPSLAGQTPLNVKPGLWEMSWTGETSGTPPTLPPDQLAKLTPEQRAKIEAAMEAAIAKGNAPHAIKHCVTQKELDRGLNVDDQNQKSCKQTVVSSTSSVLEVHMECTGRQQSSGTYRIEATSPTTITGALNMVMSDGTHSMTMKRQVAGKWLGADCGEVKPIE